jgi:large subunit ribosomal protein L32e
MTAKDTVTPERALRLRHQVKRKKPDFARSESWKYIRLKINWRRPRGLDHKMRRKIKGWPPVVNVGYRGPKVARGLHPSGLREVLVHNMEELGQVDPKTQAVRIAHVVGKRKRSRMLTEARKKKMIVLNIREVKPAVEEEKPSEVTEKEEEAEMGEEAEAAEEVEEKPKPRRRKSKKKAEAAEEKR